MAGAFQSNLVQLNAFQSGGAGASCFDPLAFDPKFFDTTCVSGSGGGHPRGRRRISIPVIDNRMHDDDLALLLLEAA